MPSSGSDVAGESVMGLGTLKQEKRKKGVTWLGLGSQRPANSAGSSEVEGKGGRAHDYEAYEQQATAKLCAELI